MPHGKAILQFPHADPGAARSFSRRTGWLELTLGTTKPDVGVPYGVPSRLLMIYCASQAVRKCSPKIYLGKSVHDFWEGSRCRSRAVRVAVSAFTPTSWCGLFVFGLM